MIKSKSTKINVSNKWNNSKAYYENFKTKKIYRVFMNKQRRY